MPHKIEPYLWDILSAGEEILSFTSGKTLGEYKGDRLLQLGMERCFITIGEAMVRIRMGHPSEFDMLPEARKVVDLRNLLTHQYDAVSDEDVWNIIQVHLQPLLREVQILLNRIKV